MRYAEKDIPNTALYLTKNFIFPLEILPNLKTYASHRSCMPKRPPPLRQNPFSPNTLLYSPNALTPPTV